MRHEAVVVIRMIMPFCNVAPCMIHMHQHVRILLPSNFILEAAGSSSALLCIYQTTVVITHKNVRPEKQVFV